MPLADRDYMRDDRRHRRPRLLTLSSVAIATVVVVLLVGHSFEVVLGGLLVGLFVVVRDRVSP